MKRSVTWILAALVVTSAAYARRSWATPSNIGFMPKTLAMATFDELNVNLHTIPADIWQARLKTQGKSDLYVQSNKWQPGGSTGWHTHPGPSLVIITSGTVTAYDGDDPSCTPHVYSALPGFENQFVDSGGGHRHLVRNEDPSADATGFAVQLIPAGAARRIDAPANPDCPADVQ